MPKPHDGPAEQRMQQQLAGNQPDLAQRGMPFGPVHGQSQFLPQIQPQGQQHAGGRRIAHQTDRAVQRGPEPQAGQGQGHLARVASRIGLPRIKTHPAGSRPWNVNRRSGRRPGQHIQPGLPHDHHDVGGQGGQARDEQGLLISGQQIGHNGQAHKGRIAGAAAQGREITAGPAPRRQKGGRPSCPERRRSVASR